MASRAWRRRPLCGRRTNLLELVVINLILNAFQAMPGGGRLTIGLRRDATPRSSSRSATQVRGFQTLTSRRSSIRSFQHGPIAGARVWGCPSLIPSSTSMAANSTCARRGMEPFSWSESRSPRTRRQFAGCSGVLKCRRFRCRQRQKPYSWSMMIKTCAGCWRARSRVSAAS